MRLKDRILHLVLFPDFKGAIRFFKRNKAFLGEKQVVPFKGMVQVVLNQKTVFVIRCMSIYYKKKEFRPDNHEVFSISQAGINSQGAVYTYFLLQT